MDLYSLEDLIFQSNHRLPSPSLPFITSSKCVCYRGWLIAVDPSLQSSLQWSCHPDQLLFVPSLVTHQQSQSLSQSPYDMAAQTDTAAWQARKLEMASLVQDELLQTKLCCGITPTGPAQSHFTHSTCTGEWELTAAGLPIFLFLVLVCTTEWGRVELDALKWGEESVKQNKLLRMIWTEAVSLLISMLWIFFKHKLGPLIKVYRNGIWVSFLPWDIRDLI